MMIWCLLAGTSYGKKYVEYTLNTSPAMTDTALGVTDPDLVPTGWSTRNYLWSDIFALYLTQDFTFTGALDSTGASSNVTGPINMTPIGTLPTASDGKLVMYTGATGFLGNSILGFYDGTTFVNTVGFETLPTTTGQVPSFNSVTGKWDMATPAGSPAGSSGVTTQAADPTVGDPTGFYLSTGTTKFWYRDSTLGNYDFGTYAFTADPAGCSGVGVLGNNGLLDQVLSAQLSRLAQYTAGADICVTLGGIATTAAFTGTDHLKIVIYSDSTGSADALLATSNEMTGNSTAGVQEVVFPTSYQITNGDTVWIGYVSDQSFVATKSFIGAGATAGEYLPAYAGYGTPPDPYGGSANSLSQIVMYVEGK